MKTQFTLMALLLVALPFLTACDQVSGSGRVATETRNVKPFSRLEVEGSMDVYITKGSGGSATLEAEDNILPLIELIEDGDKLRIKFRNNVNIRTHKDVKVELATDQLTDVELAGSGDIKIGSHFTADRPVRLSIAGSGDMEAAFSAPEIRLSIAGAGDIDLKGETRDMSVDIAGSGNCNAFDLMAETAEVNIAGSGNIKLHASRTLKASILGSGDIYYKGEPSMNVNKMGSGGVHKQ
ncbi:head GIN domain-containing protein [Chitinophaga caseinilytica]|uniref:Head GIN domain-containing protein n=1 Tax=Chitinophaga caseinilytica TaxID=2267521 RepID=A0ABZ2Z8B3_9BACT